MQEIDDVIGHKYVLKNDLPNKLSELISDVDICEAELSKISIELDNNVKKQRDKELEVKNQKDSIRKYEQQLDGIKNNKEYKALNSQISTLKDKIFNYESELISVMDEETTLKERKKQAEESLKSAKKALSENEDILKKEIIKVEDDIVELKGSRNSIAHDIPMSLVKKYAQLIKNKNRKAVVFLNGNSCGGCGFHIRPQLLIEIKQNENVNYCENCGRIIAPNVDN